MVNTIFLIGICVVLPIIVVFLNNRTSQNETNKKTEVLLKAIEAGASIDPEYFKPQVKTKSLKEKLLTKLTGACRATFIGLAIVITDTMVYDNISIHSKSYTAEKQITEFVFILGGIIFAIGIALFISYFVGKRLLAKELKAEEEALKSEK